jgi:hypothetical protein
LNATLASIRKLSLGLALLVSAAPVSSAQSVYGSIVGTVTDPSGAAIAGAKVTLTNLATNEPRAAVSDGNGDYTFVNLLPGSYGIAVEQAAFKRLVRQPIEVQVQSAIRVDAQLQVGDATQTVAVSAEAPLIQTQNATIGNEVDARQVMDLALNGRNVYNLVALTPGVVPQGGTTSVGNAATGNVNGWGNYQIGGGAGNQSAAYIDGAPVNISYVNSTILVPTQDFVQEFRVVTNDVSPEFGRFAGGIINMSSRTGTNAIHGVLYDYVRNQDFNANTFFNNKAGLARGVYQQNQYGATVGGPIKKDRTFYTASWEQMDLRQATTTTTTVPTAAMRSGDFSAKGIPSLFDPLTTAPNGSGVYARAAFPGNLIPSNRQNQAALNLQNLLFPLPTNSSLTNNYIASVPRATDYNQYNARLDHRFNERNELFLRFSDWNRNYSASSALLQTGTGGKWATTQAVAGDTFTINPTTVVDVRASFLRFFDDTLPLTCCNFDFSQIGPAWAQYNNEATKRLLPTPNIVPDNNFNGTPIILEVDNSYVISGSLTKIKGPHTFRFGGEARRIEWDYAQTNSAGSTYTFDSGFTSQFPLASSSTAGSPSNTGYGTASFLLGFPSAGSATEPDLSAGLMHYFGVFFNDSYRVSRKLTLQLGLRWESPGSFQERHNSLTTFDPNLPQTALAAATGLPIKGGLVLDGSSQRSNPSWQDPHYRLFSPRAGIAYSPNDSLVIRSGYGIAYLPNTIAFSLGPYNSPVNNAVTTMVTSLDGGLTPNLATTLSNPFPNGINPPSHSQAFVDSLIGQGIQSPIANQPYPYMQQWNFDVQKQFGGNLLVDVGYMGARGDHLTLYDINTDQIPDQYLSLGNALLNQVPNPFYGVIPASAGILGQKTVAQGYLLRPFPQYLYTSLDAPSMGDSTYESLQVKVQKRFRGGGVLMGAYTRAHMTSDADVLSPWLEANRNNVGGGQGVQDNTNIKGGEYSLSSFDVPNRFVASYVLDLPFGTGHHVLGNAHGLTEKLVGGWSINGITTFQSGFPLALMDASPNLLETDFAIGNGGPGPPGAGVSRPNYTTGCNKSVSAPTLQAHLAQWFNTSCFTQPGAFEFGSEPRVDPSMRSMGVANFDFSMSKKTTISERFSLAFRAEAYNIFNRVQFSPPNTQPGNATFGQVTAQYNQPRLLQFALRLTF